MDARGGLSAPAVRRPPAQWTNARGPACESAKRADAFRDNDRARGWQAPHQGCAWGCQVGWSPMSNGRAWRVDRYGNRCDIPGVSRAARVRETRARPRVHPRIDRLGGCLRLTCVACAGGQRKRAREGAGGDRGLGCAVQHEVEDDWSERASGWAVGASIQRVRAGWSVVLGSV